MIICYNKFFIDNLMYWKIETKLNIFPRQVLSVAICKLPPHHLPLINPPLDNQGSRGVRLNTLMSAISHCNCDYERFACQCVPDLPIGFKRSSTSVLECVCTSASTPSARSCDLQPRQLPVCWRKKPSTTVAGSILEQDDCNKRECVENDSSRYVQYMKNKCLTLQQEISLKMYYINVKKKANLDKFYEIYATK